MFRLPKNIYINNNILRNTQKNCVYSSKLLNS